MKWVRIGKGTTEAPEFRCRLVAQELEPRERLDELPAGAPFWIVARMLLHKVSLGMHSMGIMGLGIKCAFLFGKMRRSVHI